MSYQVNSSSVIIENSLSIHQNSNNISLNLTESNINKYEIYAHQENKNILQNIIDQIIPYFQKRNKNINEEEIFTLIYYTNIKIHNSNTLTSKNI